MQPLRLASTEIGSGFGSGGRFLTRRGDGDFSPAAELQTGPNRGSQRRQREQVCSLGPAGHSCIRFLFIQNCLRHLEWLQITPGVYTGARHI